MLQKGPPFRFSEYLELIQNRLKPKGPPLWFLGIVRLFFQLDRTVGLLSILYHIFLGIFSFALFHLVKGYPWLS